MTVLRPLVTQLGRRVRDGAKCTQVHFSAIKIQNYQYSTFKRERVPEGVGVFGACFDGGQPHRGTGQAPKLIREAGLVDRLKNMGCNIVDHGDLTGERGGKEEVFQFSKNVSETVSRILGMGQVAVTLGGDHSVGLGTLAGHLQHDPEAVVIWVDAHADINTLASSASGNMHGMPVSFNIQSLNNGEPSWLVPRLLPSRLAYLGLRDVEESERRVLDELGIAAYYIQDIDRLGLAGTVGEALARVDPGGNRNIHMSFDIDVLDPLEAPATGTKVRGGLTLREGQQLSALIHSTGRLRAVDLVEVNPALGKDNDEVERTVDAACNVIMASLGYRKNTTF